MRNSKISAHIALIALFLLLAFSRHSSADLIDPDPVCLLEAQQIALDLSGQLRPPTELTEQIYNDLAAIRSSYPEFADITYRPHATPDEVMVGLTQEAAEQFRNGQYHALDELNQLYGVIAINDRLLSSISVIILKFNQVYNTNLLSDIYAQAEGVRYAEPNYMIGDGSTIDADPPFYTFILAWGDCPAGCIYREFHHFKVENGCVTIPDERYVDALNGDDDNYGLTHEKAFATIQAAVDAAVDGDTVIVADGTYTGIGNRDIDFLGKAITVRSESGPQNCIIDCNGSEAEQHRGFYFHNGEDANSVLSGFTITGGYGPDEEVWSQLIPVAGAIFCKSSSPTIHHCIIRDNYSFYGGGMFNCENSNPAIVNCKFTNNRVSDIGRGGALVNDQSNPTLIQSAFVSNRGGRAAGAIQNSASSPVISRCTFTGNSVLVIQLTGGGGGAICNSVGSPVLTNCIFTGNHAGWGGAISNEGSSPKITHCTFAGNYGGGNTICNWLDTCSPTLINCILWNGADEILNKLDATIDVTYSDVEGGWLGLGNIHIDPCFVEPGFWADTNDPNAIWVDGDYHLLPTSPCIDAGDPNYVPEPNETDLDGKPRVIGTRIDMGAYEYAPPIMAEINIKPKTLNLSSKGKWIMCLIRLPEDYSIADIDPDSILLEDEIPPDRVWLLNKFAVAKFSRSALQELLADIDTPATVDLLVSGQLNDDTSFEGTDTIRLTDKKKKLPHSTILKRKL